MPVFGLSVLSILGFHFGISYDSHAEAQSMNKVKRTNTDGQKGTNAATTNMYVWHTGWLGIKNLRFTSTVLIQIPRDRSTLFAEAGGTIKLVFRWKEKHNISGQKKSYFIEACSYSSEF